MKIKVPNGIDNKGRQVFNEVEIETKEAKLLVKIDTLAEALRFYAADENYHMHDTYGNTNVRNDNGKIAREALKEIEG